MASFLIDTSAVAVTGTNEGDTFQIISGGNELTVEGLAGDDTVTFSGTAGTLNDSFFYLREGDDSFDVGSAGNSAGLTNSFVGGAQGDDDIVFSAGGQAFVGTTLNGGQGQDTITVAGFSGTASGFSINGGRDDDTLNFGTAGDLNNAFVGVGKGDDQLTFSVTGGAVSGLSMAGGLGEDTIDVSGRFFNDTVINGGGNGTDIDSDSGDSIDIDISAGNGFTVLGNGGDDTISAGITDTAGNVSINGNAGDDTINYSADTSVGVTIGGGKGDDTLAIDSDGTITVNGGIGEDVINTTAGSAGVVVNGGADADTITVGQTAGLAVTTFSDSDFNDRGIVNVSGGGASAGTVTISTIGGLGVLDAGTTAGSANGSNVTINTAGIVEGLETAGITELTAAVNFLSENLDTNETVIFTTTGGSLSGGYALFTKGSETDLVVEFAVSAGSAGVAANSTTQGTDLEVTFS